MTTVLDEALAFARNGCSVIPAAADGTKAPLGAWKQWQAQRPDDTQLRAWLAGGHPGIGIVTGAISGNLEMLEFEAAAVTDHLVAAAAELATAAGIGDVWHRLAAGYMEYTPSGGIHFLYRVAGHPVPGSIKLARGPHHSTLIETRGEGGFTITAPSGGPVHPTGKPWAIVTGGPATIPVLQASERNALHSILRTLGEQPEPPAPFTQPHREPSATGGVAPGEDYNQRTDWAQILKPLGWAHVTTRGTVRYWRRPGKDKGISATTGRPPHDNLYAFTTSTALDPETPYSKFGVLAELHHGGDHSAAASALRAQGYGTPPPVPAIAPPAFQQPAAAPAPPAGPAAAAPDSEQPPRSSWHPLDLGPILDGDTSGDPEPVTLTRDDGRKLFYAGKVNGLIGESESGKTWVALAAVTEHLADGDHVAYYDFEDSAAGIVGRLISMGADPAAIRGRFHYASPDEPLTAQAAADIAELLASRAPHLAVVDGVNSAMTLLGLNLKDNKDATEFSQRILRPLKRTGATVITVDHVTKNPDSRGLSAIGAQAKRADIDGAAIIVEAVKKFGRGQEGKLRLTVSKDRPGHVRAISNGATYAGMVTLTSRENGTVTVTIAAPDMRPAEEKKPWRPTGFMERISKLIEDTPAITSRSIQQAITGKASHISDALSALTGEGWVVTETGPRGAVLHTSARPYREASDHPAPDRFPVPDRFPTDSPAPGKRSSAEPADRFPQAPIGTSSQGGRETVGRTGAREPDTSTTVSPASHCRTCGERLPHTGRPCQDPEAAA